AAVGGQCGDRADGCHGWREQRANDAKREWKFGDRRVAASDRDLAGIALLDQVLEAVDQVLGLVLVFLHATSTELPRRLLQVPARAHERAPSTETRPRWRAAGRLRSWWLRGAA